MSTLKDRIENYYDSTNYKLLNRVPLIICINGRKFSKLTSLLDKPYCEKFAEAMLSTTLRLCSEVDGSVFGYSFNDEIILAIRTDLSENFTPFYDNDLQNICSVSSSIATQHFNNISSSINLLDDGIFRSRIFPVPNISELMNAFIYKQQQNFYISIQSACFYELLKKYNRDTIKKMLSGLGPDEKISILKDECSISFNEYPIAFRRGAACYKTSKIVGDVLKNKWTLNTELPIFTKDKLFLENILNGI